MRNTKSIILASTLLLAVSTLTHAQVISNYTGWMNDYDGTEANTRFLFTFEETTGIYSYNRVPGEGVIPTRGQAASEGTALGAQGRFGSGLQIANSTGNDSYFQIGSPNLGELSQVSFEMWYKPANEVPGVANSARYLADQRYNDLKSFNMFFKGDGTDIRTQIGNGTTTMFVDTGSLEWDTDTWYHLAFTYDAASGALKFYRNGELLNQTINENFGNIAEKSPGVMRIGNRNGSSYGSAAGTYDNVRVSTVVYEYSVIPEPGTIALIFGIGALALGIIRKRQRN